MILKPNASHNNQPRNIFSIGVWENEGGAPACDCPDGQYGRRMEADRSWTVYHVFTGVPARQDGRTMSGLNRTEATDGILTLNRRSNSESPETRRRLMARARLPEPRTKYQQP
jgi:hypothetical protein